MTEWLNLYVVYIIPTCNEYDEGHMDFRVMVTKTDDTMADISRLWLVECKFFVVVFHLVWGCELAWTVHCDHCEHCEFELRRLRILTQVRPWFAYYATPGANNYAIHCLSSVSVIAVEPKVVYLADELISMSCTSYHALRSRSQWAWLTNILTSQYLFLCECKYIHS